jgi:hypothetical protein
MSTRRMHAQVRPGIALGLEPRPSGPLEDGRRRGYDDRGRHGRGQHRDPGGREVDLDDRAVRQRSLLQRDDGLPHGPGRRGPQHGDGELHGGDLGQSHDDGEPPPVRDSTPNAASCTSRTGTTRRRLEDS